METGPDMGHAHFLGTFHAGGPGRDPQSFACGQRWQDAAQRCKEEDAHQEEPFCRASESL